MATPPAAVMFSPVPVFEPERVVEPEPAPIRITLRLIVSVSE